MVDRRYFQALSVILNDFNISSYMLIPKNSSLQIMLTKNIIFEVIVLYPDQISSTLMRLITDADSTIFFHTDTLRISFSIRYSDTYSKLVPICLESLMH